MIYKALTDDDKANITRMLLGPFNEDWYDFDGIVDNTDETISKRLNLSRPSVALFTTKLLKDKENDRLMQNEIYDCKNCTNTKLGCKKHFRYFKLIKK